MEMSRAFAPTLRSKTRRGQTLAEVLVGGVVLIIFSLAIGRFFVSQSRTLKRAEKHAVSSDIETRLDTLSHSPDFCGSSFRDASGTAALKVSSLTSPLSVPYLYFGPLGGSIDTSLVMFNAKSIAPLGKQPSIRALRFVSFKDDGNFSVEGANSITLHRVLASLEVTEAWSDPNLGSQTEKHKIIMPLALDSSGKIVSCGDGGAISGMGAEDDGVETGSCGGTEANRSKNPSFAYAMDSSTGKTYCRGFQPYCPENYFLQGVGENGEALCTALPDYTPKAYGPGEGTVTCSSSGYKPQDCAIIDMPPSPVMIDDLYVEKRYSDSNCVRGDDFGIKDVLGNTCDLSTKPFNCKLTNPPYFLWSKDGCRAKFGYKYSAPPASP